MTIKFENMNVRYGHNGPFEAESKEALADDMMPTLIDWADDPNATQTAEDMRAEFIEGLEAQYHGEPRIIFDNGGNATLQLPGYAHTYDDMDWCAEDIHAWIEDEDASGWGGNEESAVFEPAPDQISNRRYDVCPIDVFIDTTIKDAMDESWGNIRNLFAAMAQKLLND